MSKRYTNTGNKHIVSVYLDDDTHALLVSAKNRSGRTKSTEVAMRLALLQIVGGDKLIIPFC
ncbi:TraY domain-containing protein [Escherichia sp.]|uniref:TraY domain-containing protein n=1 Tax=Escherichia sp. TaxID=1884818 RepID=UPI002588B31C|nr:TraY domain-containing protein [Escherichia sp.]